MSVRETDSIPTYEPRVDVIIIGAGLSGLTSALRIIEMERSLQVKILEAADRVGGQLEQTDLGEIGAKWITKDQYHIYKLLQAMQVPLRQRSILGPRLQRCWDIDKGMFASLEKYELTRYLRELDIKVQFYKPERNRPLKRTMSMRRHICRRLFFNKSRKFMTNLVHFITGADAEDISYSEFMTICYTCGGLDMLIDLYLICPEDLIEVSSDKLFKALLGRLQSVDILLEHKVREIQHFKDFVEVTDVRLHIHTASAVILALPWNCIQDIFIRPSMPLELRKPIADEKRSNQIISSFLVKYNDGYWRKFGYSGSILCLEPMIMMTEYRPTVLSGMMVHRAGVETAVPSIVLQMLARNFGDIMLRPIDFHHRSYEMNSMLNVAFTKPWNRIVWSSSAGAATCFRGCLSGAVQSGLRAAMNVMLIVRPQTVSVQDMAEIQCTDSLQKREIHWIKLFLSTWNLYNVTYYTLFICGTLAVLRYAYRRRT